MLNSVHHEAGPMSHEPRRGLQAVIIALGIVAAVGAIGGSLWFDWRDQQPRPIDRTATRWANTIAEQDAESIRNNDPDYKAPKFEDRPGQPYPNHPNTWHPDHPKAKQAP